MIVSLSFFPISDFEKFSELERFRLGLVSWPWNPRCVCRIVSGSLEAETWVKQRSGSGETEKLARWKFRTERGERIYGALLTLIESKTFLKTRWVYWNLWNLWNLLEFLEFIGVSEVSGFTGKMSLVHRNWIRRQDKTCILLKSLTGI